MNDTEKCRIRLSHWIDHNIDHLKGYMEVAAILDKEGLAEAAAEVKEGISLIEAANDRLRRSVGKLPHDHSETGEGEPSGHHHHHSGHCGACSADHDPGKHKHGHGY
jgi:hypothetical protein